MENANITELTPQPSKSFSLTPTTLKEAMDFSKMIADSDICPKDFQGKEGNVLVAVQMGAELGISPIQALQNIAVINGRPSVWGDALPALAKAHPRYEYIDESFDDSTMTATCKIKRKGEPEQTYTFSKADADTAGLWGKGFVWPKYPKRMLKMRARGYAVRDVFPDALKGLQVAEEMQDIKEMGEVDRIDTSNEDFSPKAKTEAAPANVTPHKETAGAEVVAEEKEPVTIDQAAEDNSPKINANQINLVSAKLDHSGIGQNDFFKQFSISDFGDLQLSKINEALTWISENGA